MTRTRKDGASGRRPLLLLLALLTAVSGFLFLSSLEQSRRREHFWEEVRSARREWTGTATEWENVLPAYQALYERNRDMVGWLDMTIVGVRIDFPVMQTREDPEFYLRRDFDGNPDSTGTPFLDYRCSVSPRRCFNLILYGHYVSGYKMFGGLVDYADERVARENRRFRFDTLAERGVYEVEAAFFYDATEARLYLPSEDAGDQAYTFYNYIELDSEEGFSCFLQNIKDQTLYSWEPEITPEDQLLTIVCCAPEPYTGLEEGGRFVVIAKRVE